MARHGLLEPATNRGPAEVAGIPVRHRGPIGVSVVRATTSRPGPGIETLAEPGYLIEVDAIAIVG